MKLDEEGKRFIKKWEGCRLSTYSDISGFHTIGYGHKQTGLSEFRTITQAQAEQLFENDVTDAECVVRNLVTVPLTQNQFNALVSFVFNLGGSAFRSSTLLKLLNQKKYLEAANQFPRWCYGRDKDGKAVQNKGLLNRRNAEKEVFSA